MSLLSSFIGFFHHIIRDQKGILGVGDTVRITGGNLNVEVTNEANIDSKKAVDIMGGYLKERHEYEGEMMLATLAELAFALVQLGYYADRLRNAVNNRDDTIQDQVNFITELRKLMYGQDLSAINKKFGILGVAPPENNHCVENVAYKQETVNDGDAVDQMSRRFIRESPRRLPTGWLTHDGKLASALSIPVNGSYHSAAADRRKYDFIKAKVGLLHGTQRSVKALFNASMVLAEYDKAIGIYGGLADIFIQGFNSAGAALGTALGKLANAASHSSPDTSSPSGGIRIGMRWGA